MIKKASLLTTGIIVYLSLALPTTAASIDPCPSGGGFGKLCTYNSTTLTKVIANGITILFIVATVASIIFLILGGIKWITSGGDKGKIEEARNWIIAAIIGLIITLASYFIISFILALFGLNEVGNYSIPNLVN